MTILQPSETRRAFYCCLLWQKEGYVEELKTLSPTYFPVTGRVILSKSVVFSGTQFSHSQKEQIGLDISMVLSVSNIL